MKWITSMVGCIKHDWSDWFITWDAPHDLWAVRKCNKCGKFHKKGKDFGDFTPHEQEKMIVDLRNRIYI